MSLILLTTILALGALVGLTTLRNQIVQEFTDIAVALDHLDQTFDGPLGTFLDNDPNLADDPGVGPAGIDVNVAP